MTEEHASEIRKRLVTGFAINRIPKKELNWFIKFAKDEFEDDRGFALKHLINVYNGIITTGVEHLENAVENLDARIKALEKEAEKPPEPKYRTMMDGTKQRIGEKTK